MQLLSYHKNQILRNKHEKKKKKNRNGLEHTNLSFTKQIEKSRTITHYLCKSVTQVIDLQIEKTTIQSIIEYKIGTKTYN